MDSKPNWPFSQLADGYHFVDAASMGFNGAILTIPSSLTGFEQTAFGYVQDPSGGTTMCFGGILTSCDNPPCCPKCGRRMHINGTVTGELKHVPFGNIPVSIGFQKYLYRCPDCGHCISEPVEFQAEGHRITKQLQQMVEDCLAYGFNLTDTAQITGVGRNVVKSIDKARLTKQYVTDDGKLKKPEAYSEVLGIDEIMIHAGHQYATIIIDMMTGHVLWIRQTKKKQVVYDFMDHVGPEWMSHVKAVASDMNADFQKAFQEKYPHIRAVYDHFHIVKNLNDRVISEIRKDEIRRLSKEGKTDEAKELKGSKYILTASVETLEEKDKRAADHHVIRPANSLFDLKEIVQKGGKMDRYRELLDQNELFFACDVIKEKLKKAYECSLPMHMGRVISSLIRFCFDSGNKHIIWFGKLLKDHYDGIISYASFHITNGKMEGTNRKIDTIRRDGYGYPDDEYFFLKVIDLSRCPSSAKKHDRLLKKTTRHIPPALYAQII